MPKASETINSEKKQLTDTSTKLNKMLELSHKDFKFAIMNTFQ